MFQRAEITRQSNSLCRNLRGKCREENVMAAETAHILRVSVVNV